MGVFVLGGGLIKKFNHHQNNVQVVTPTKINSNHNIILPWLVKHYLITFENVKFF
jgi:hypothetical protein